MNDSFEKENAIHASCVPATDQKCCSAIWVSCHKIIHNCFFFVFAAFDSWEVWGEEIKLLIIVINYNQRLKKERIFDYVSIIKVYYILMTRAHWKLKFIWLSTHWRWWRNTAKKSFTPGPKQKAREAVKLMKRHSKVNKSDKWNQLLAHFLMSVDSWKWK